MLSILRAIVSSRLFPVIAIGVSLFAWHTFNKSSAVRRAVDNYIAADTIATLKAEKAEIKRRMQIFALENESLAEDVASQKVTEANLKRELDDFIANKNGDQRCPMSDDLFGRLRNK